jgi:hypothetical protein
MTSPLQDPEPGDLVGEAAAPPDSDRMLVLDALSAQLTVATDPIAVFASLARGLVPAFSDSCSIALAEDHRETYRITCPERRTSPRSRGDLRFAGRHELRTPVHGPASHGFEGFSGEVVHSWTRRRPTAVDGVVARLAVDVALAAIARERDADYALRSVNRLHTALTARRLFSAAISIVMDTEGLTDAAAFDRLMAASQRTNRPVGDVARDVVCQGRLVAP